MSSLDQHAEASNSTMRRAASATMRLSGVNAARSRALGLITRASSSTSSPSPPSKEGCSVPDSSTPRELTVFYDGACPLCAKEISHLNGLDESPSGQCAIEFVDLASLPDDATLRARLGSGSTVTRSDAMGSLHIVNNRTGAVSTGMESFVAMWSRLPYWRTFSRLFSVPGVMPVANVVYGVWARNRNVLKR